jgi:hypothetical protein
MCLAARGAPQAHLGLVAALIPVVGVGEVEHMVLRVADDHAADVAGVQLLAHVLDDGVGGFTGEGDEEEVVERGDGGVHLVDLAVRDGLAEGLQQGLDIGALLRHALAAGGGVGVVGVDRAGALPAAPGVGIIGGVLELGDLVVADAGVGEVDAARADAEAELGLPGDGLVDVVDPRRGVLADELDAGGAGVAEAVAAGRGVAAARLHEHAEDRRAGAGEEVLLELELDAAGGVLGEQLVVAVEHGAVHAEVEDRGHGRAAGAAHGEQGEARVLAVGGVVLAAAVAIDEIVGVPVVGGGGAPFGGSEVGDGVGDDLGELGRDPVDDLLVGGVGADGREGDGQAPVAGDVVVRVGGGGDQAAAEVEVVQLLELGEGALGDRGLGAHGGELEED